MPEKETLDRAREDAREGKSSSTQAGEFAREEMHHIREGKHGARSTKQAIAIGLSKARRAGVKLQRPRRGTASAQTRSKAGADLRRGRTRRKPSQKRSRATTRALQREGRSAASRRSRHRVPLRRRRARSGRPSRRCERARCGSHPRARYRRSATSRARDRGSRARCRS